jgi:hypothetical protein
MDRDQETFNRLAGKRNLYHISQRVNNDYDTWSDAIVAAWTVEEARVMHPDGSVNDEDHPSGWAKPSDVEVQFIGVGEPNIEGVVCASYHAG